MKWCPIMVAARLMDGQGLAISITDSPCNDSRCGMWDLCHPSFLECMFDGPQDSTEPHTVNSGA